MAVGLGRLVNVKLLMINKFMLACYLTDIKYTVISSMLSMCRETTSDAVIRYAQPAKKPYG